MLSLDFSDLLDTPLAFGRQNNYKIDPDQELIAVGMTNILGVFFSSYPTTASFSATALKAKCHVPTPLSGLFTSALIILSLYVLTGAFYYVPTAGLAAVIISSSIGLIDGSEGIHYWQISRIEAVIWVSSVIATVTSGVQYGISVAILASLALLLVRIAKPRGEFLGTTTLRLIDDQGKESTREVFVPLDLGDEGVLHINAVVKPPAPWIAIYRLGESFTYPNATSVNMSIMEYFKENARRSPDLFDDGKKERLWNETESLDTRTKDEREKWRRPIRAVIFDFASVYVYSLCSSDASFPDLLRTVLLSIAQVRKSSEILKPRWKGGLDTLSTFVLSA
jgi:solute carrier family 26 (sodium-independent sulfate anion transporter), member 11